MTPFRGTVTPTPTLPFPRYDASDELADEAREWVARRNWKRSPYGPALGALYVASGVGSRPFTVRRLADNEVVSTELTAEHAKRYVEHVYNFGRLPR